MQHTHFLRSNGSVTHYLDYHHQSHLLFTTYFWIDLIFSVHQCFSPQHRISRNIGELKIWRFDANELWLYFNLADCSLQHMKLYSFIILAKFKFGVMDLIRQIAKLKSSPKFSVYGIFFCFLACLSCFLFVFLTLLFLFSIFFEVLMHSCYFSSCSFFFCALSSSIVTNSELVKALPQLLFL